MVKFALKRGTYSDVETKALAIHAALTREIELHYFNRAIDVPEDYIPQGDIGWVTSVLGFVPRPDHYPPFLLHLLYRKIWKAEKWPMEKGIFIKPYDKPKRFSARITTGTYKGKKKGPYWCSEKVTFINEWRYYFVEGKQVYAGWYIGNDEDQEPPELNIDIPKDWCGCIDMGFLSTGEFALVECNSPYAVGWYGSLNNASIYVDFLIKGWAYLKRGKQND